MTDRDPRIPLRPREVARRLRKIAETVRKDAGEANALGPFWDIELDDIAFGLELHARLEHEEALNRAWRSVKNDVMGEGAP